MKIPKLAIKISFFVLIILAAFTYFPIKKAKEQKPYNFILISFDGLQAKHLREYGYAMDTTPNLDKFLDRSYLFLNTVSPAPWTVPSHMSIMTSMYPSEHKVVNKFSAFDEKTKKGETANLAKLSPTAVTLAQILKNNGYVTAGFTGDAGVKGIYGFNMGFDTYFDQETFGGFDQSMPKALDWLSKNKDKRFFLFLHGYDVHGQHAPIGGFDYRYVQKPYNGRFTGSTKEQGALREEGLKNGTLNLSAEDKNFWRAIYDEKINRADDEFKDFLSRIENMGLLNNTILVLFSDHGTEFFEHGRVDHGHTLYNELLGVLFAIHLPGQTNGKKINSLVSTIDIMPTVLSILNIKNPVPQQTRGVDLTPSFTGKDVSRNIFSETDYRLYTHKRSMQTSDGWKFILTMNGPEKELYDLKNDPNEQVNLVDKEPKVAYELEQDIYKHLKDMNADYDNWLLGCSPVYADQCQ